MKTPPKFSETRIVTTDMTLTAISLFSGALGLDLGVERAGFDIRVAVEIDKTACNTIRANRPELCLVEGDVSKLTGSELLEFAGVDSGALTLLFGGAPCQSFSTAGRRQSLSDPRGNLVLEFIRLVDEMKPDYFILENVRGILSAAIKHRPIVDRLDDRPNDPDEEQGSVLRYMYELFDRIGYVTHHRLLMAADFGVPQKRQRVFFIGSKNGSMVPFPNPTHSETPDLFTPKPWVTLKYAFENLEQTEVEAPGYTEERLRYMRFVPQGGYWRDLPKELQKQALGGAYFATGGRVGFYRRLSLDAPAPTLVTSPDQKGTMMCHPTEDRPLSVAEYARIQQFPDNWVFTGSMSAKYRQIGNAVPVGLSYAVAHALREHIENSKRPVGR
ncbi:MAG: Modification methylase HaeIII [Anaerolineae bacterium]|nr:Modification methylase HaeIII [Anaerolineae bacterium]